VPPQPSYRVLLADPADRRGSTLADQLAELGHEVCLTATADAAAVEADLILSDAALFAALGAELARERERAAAEHRRVECLVRAVIPIGVALMAEKDFHRLLEAILDEAKSLCNADGGTLYLCGANDELEFVLLRNDSLGIALGGPNGEPIPFAPLTLHDPTSGAPNLKNVATYVAVTARSINLSDAYEACEFDFAGTRAFDAHSGYRSQSFLTVPLKNAGGAVIGVLQLINALDRASGAVIRFDPELEPVVESLSMLAAAALEAYQREQHLRAQIAELHIQIDEGRRERQVEEIADSDYFQMLQGKAKALRGRSRS
jgi:transcriptional regulator with GAF, ATPase, and Fis domain